MSEESFEELLTEARNPASESIGQLTTERMMEVINAEDAAVPGAVRAEIPQIAKGVDIIASRLRAGGHLFYVGAGTSGRLAVLDAAECAPTFNVSPDLVQAIIAGGDAAVSHAAETSEDDFEAGARDLQGRKAGSEDVVVGIAASGRTPYVLGAIDEARRLGAVTIGISCTPQSKLAQAVDIPITPLTGPEVITGSTRLKAGTATKLVLNMLSTGAMIRLGYVYGNLMVNVKPVNRKLHDRAARIICYASGISRPDAERLLDEAGGNVRAAIAMAMDGLTPDEARARFGSPALQHG